MSTPIAAVDLAEALRSLVRVSLPDIEDPEDTSREYQIAEGILALFDAQQKRGAVLPSLPAPTEPRATELLRELVESWDTWLDTPVLRNESATKRHDLALEHAREFLASQPKQTGGSNG